MVSHGGKFQNAHCEWHLRKINEQLKATREDIQRNGLSLRQAVIKYSIPQSILSDHLTDKSTKRYGSAPTVLSPEEKHKIVITCHVLADMGFPLNKDYVSLIIRHYINEKYKKAHLGLMAFQDIGVGNFSFTGGQMSEKESLSNFPNIEQ